MSIDSINAAAAAAVLVLFNNCIRRAKRLRRIKQQLDSPLARLALNRFWRGMWLAAGVLLAAHIICFAILATIVKSQGQGE
jgi:predicted lysophospholipase L1 biosynthesis ABC-type transport system permease subunit